MVIPVSVALKNLFYTSFNYSDRALTFLDGFSGGLKRYSLIVPAMAAFTTLLFYNNKNIKNINSLIGILQHGREQ